MLLLLALWVIAGTPLLGTPIPAQQPDGSWKCSAFCFVSGNDDGGYCRLPVVSRQPTEDACKADLARICAQMKPPPGGCRLGS
ncbi:MAG TPA: hypothetical protein VFT91_05690 [Dehalococcoidia bacterium]|nr:hypothetical protein [Dehalococcoidia bacterium]